VIGFIFIVVYFNFFCAADLPCLFGSLDFGAVCCEPVLGLFSLLMIDAPFLWLLVNYSPIVKKLLLGMSRATGSALSKHKKLAFLPVVIRNIAYSRLGYDDAVVKAHDKRAGIDELIVLKDANALLLLDNLFKITVCIKTSVYVHM
jgi:hypothetical protein